MIHSRRKHTLDSIAAASTLLLLTWSCGGSSTSGPTEPPTVVEVTGQWLGSTTLESVSGVSGCGCLSEEYTNVIGVENRTEWDIAQSGLAIRGRYWDDWGGSWCDFTGAVGTTSFSATATKCDLDLEERQMRCANGNQRDLVLAGSSWQGTVSSANRVIDGDWVRTWNCFKSQNGEAAGTLTEQFSFRLTR